MRQDSGLAGTAESSRCLGSWPLPSTVLVRLEQHRRRAARDVQESRSSGSPEVARQSRPHYHMLMCWRSPALRWSRRLRNVALNPADPEWIFALPPRAWTSSAAAELPRRGLPDGAGRCRPSGMVSWTVPPSGPGTFPCASSTAAGYGNVLSFTWRVPFSLLQTMSSFRTTIMSSLKIQTVLRAPWALRRSESSKSQEAATSAH